jgi:hypothetical protein
MATTTPNYGWTVPTSTDLVKDGATAIETLGDAIDASMNTALGTKKAGMVLLNTTSFSGVATQAVNNCFSATYDNYRIVVNIDSASSTGYNTISLRFGTSGTPNTNASYTEKGVYVDTNSATWIIQNGTTSAYIATAPGNTTTDITASIDIFNPFTSKATYFSGFSNGSRTYANFRNAAFSGIFDATTSFTDFNFFPNANNITGSISIYGYNK